MSLDPYPNGQGDGADPDRPPVLAFVERDPIEQMEATGWPWPPYEQVEAPPCGSRSDVAAEHTVDGRPRRFWCDRLAGHADDPSDARHRCVVDLEGGRSLTWGKSLETIPGG